MIGVKSDDITYIYSNNYNFSMYLLTEHMIEILHRAQSAERESLQSEAAASPLSNDTDNPPIPKDPVSSKFVSIFLKVQYSAMVYSSHSLFLKTVDS